MLLAQASLAVKPGKGPLHHPAHRFNLEALALVRADMHRPLPLVLHIVNKGASISLVSAQSLHSRQLGQRYVGEYTAFNGIRAVGRMHMHGPKVAFRVHCRLAAAALDLFAAMKTARFTFVAGLDALGVNQQVARRWMTPFFCRLLLLSSRHTSSHTPRRCMRWK